ncbi:tyrosine-type recombinase/integrase [Aromatoleum toluclasticum]|uniref:tyrosine-type recombinase/integrase n=1 Tax=Aromatoleum toluclasticum TaxID=92003 RepID=UPI00037A6411|nr:site-specific integrase [Aromatoleum toluclasticum]
MGSAKSNKPDGPQLDTDEQVGAIRPREKEYAVRDKNRPGFALRVLPSGQKTWYFIYDLEHKRRRLWLGEYPAMSLAEARAKYETERAQVKNRDDPVDVAEVQKEARAAKRQRIVADRQAMTVSELCTYYIDHYAKPRKASWREDERILNLDVIPAWGRRKAESITRLDVIELMDRIKARAAGAKTKDGNPSPRKGVQANRTHSIVRKMFNFAQERGIVAANPAVRIKDSRVVEPSRDRALSRAELRVILNALPAAPFGDDVRDILRLMLLTGQRQGEVRMMTVEHIDLTAAEWTQPAHLTKTHKTHVVPLSRQALAIIKARIEAAKGASYLFPGTTRAKERKDGPIGKSATDHAVTRWLTHETKRLAVQDWTPHDLRRAVATHLASMGYNRTVVERIQNHADRSIGGIYDRHSYRREMATTLQAWADELDRIALGNNVVPISMGADQDETRPQSGEAAA